MFTSTNIHQHINAYILSKVKFGIKKINDLWIGNSRDGQRKQQSQPTKATVSHKCQRRCPQVWFDLTVLTPDTIPIAYHRAMLRLGSFL